MSIYLGIHENRITIARLYIVSTVCLHLYYVMHIHADTREMALFFIDIFNEKIVNVGIINTSGTALFHLLL